jgi:hypothetical protein
MDFCYPILAAGDLVAIQGIDGCKMGTQLLQSKTVLASAEQQAEQIPQRALRASET